MSYPLNNHILEEAPTVIGPQGPQGPRGPQGDRGPQGVQGRTGDTGPMGPMGPTGPKGDRGDVGPQGPRGPRGEQGPQGERGNDGFNGLRGPRGYEGPQGPAGRDGSMRWDALTEDQRRQLKGEKGDRGDVGPQGPQGEKGERGLQGATGIQGPRGFTGANGPQGPKGNTGDVGPRGPKGDRGERGPQGEGKGLDHSEHIGEASTWNSKTIAEYVMHGKAKWVHSQVYQDGIKDTINGFVKDLEVHGKTMINYVNIDELKNPIKSTIETEAKFPNGREMYVKKDGKPTLKTSTTYSFICNMKVDRGVVKEDLGDHIEIIVMGVSGGRTSFEIPLNEGVIKKAFNSTEEIKSVNVNFYERAYPQPGDENDVAFTVKDFMILVGDYEQAIVPRYFWDTRGVGDRIQGAGDTERKRKLILESSNKNLVDLSKVNKEMYLTSSEIRPSEYVYRWVIGQEGSVASFLVYCKQRDYVLTIKTKKGMHKHLRCMVAGYTDVPSNGQDADERIFKLDDGQIDSKNGYISIHFKPTGNIGVLALYVANLALTDEEKRTHTSKLNWEFHEVIDEIQLEEGLIASDYEPYRRITKELEIPKAIMDDEVMEWDPILKRYAIYNNSTIPKQVTPTNITEEALISTFEGMTYFYVKNKIPSVIWAKFPIKTDGGSVYYKDEWGFRGNDIEIQDDNSKNFLKLPNGLFMQWREVRLNGTNPVEVLFPSAKEIIHAQTTMKWNSTAEIKDCVVSVELRRGEPNKVYLRASNGAFTGGEDKVYLMIISDNSKDEV